MTAHWKWYAGFALHVVALGITGCSQAVPEAGMEPAAAVQSFGTESWAFPAGSLEPAHSMNGMVSTTDRVASEIGAEMLRRGGNAVDAAIATHFALAVVNPEAGNIGGGGFMVIRFADGRTASLDFREKAPLAASRDMYLDANGEPTNESREGYRASGVPGSVAGMWAAHERFGSLPWADLLAPAIALADGLVMHERLAQSLADYSERLQRYPATAAIFAPNGRAPRVGERWVQADLAATLRRIAENGHDGFYRGRTAQLIAEEMRRGGGLITEQDLAQYQAVWRDPIDVGYRGYRIITMPPPSSGGATLGELFGILSGYDLTGMGYHSAEHIHVFTEALRRAFADRNFELADPDFVDVPVERMISSDYADERRSTIDPDRATPSLEVEPGLGAEMGLDVVPESANTTHYSVVDRSGNAVAVTTTLNSLYGNVVTIAGAGILMNNEMDDFSSLPGAPNMFGLVEGTANSIAPGKRMLSSMTPTIVVGPDGRLAFVTGSPGGPTIITTVAQTISNVVDFGMSAADAVAAPRLHHQHLPDVVQYERGGLRPEVVQRLEAMGHDMEERNGYSGDVQFIAVSPGEGFVGVADPRRGGAAVGVNGRLEVYQ